MMKIQEFIIKFREAFGDAAQSFCTPACIGKRTYIHYPDESFQGNARYNE